MRHFILALAFLSFSNYSYSSESPFRYKLALRIASVPAVKNLAHSLADIETENLKLQLLNKDDNYLNEVGEDLALFTCAQEPKSTFQWIIKHNEHEKAIGLVGFYNVNEKHASATLALYFEPEYRNKKVLADAMKTIIDFGFTQIGLNRIDFYLYPDKRGFTETSLVCDSLGFVKVGELPEFIYQSGCYHNFILYCLLKKNLKQF